MGLRPQLLAGFQSTQTSGAVIDYRLTRQRLLEQFRQGRIARSEICDAHPELERVARNCGRSTDVRCPVCDHSNVVLCTYAFGPRLGPSGRFVADSAEMDKLRSKSGTFTCYVVEVCPECSWNHLARSFEL